MGYHTVYGWLKYFQKNGDYFHTQKRGRKRILSQTECAEVQDAITKLRTEPNAESLTANTVASVARGVVSSTSPAVLAKNGGAFVMGAEWGRYHRHSVDWVPYSATSDRTVPLPVLLDAGQAFFSYLTSGYVPCKKLVFNLDEFLVLPGPNRRWTWHPRSQTRRVPIRKTKLGFICTVVTDATGNLVFLQMIREGATAAVHARVDAEDPKIFQDHQPKSRFQNANTYRCLVYCTPPPPQSQSPSQSQSQSHAARLRCTDSDSDSEQESGTDNERAP